MCFKNKRKERRVRAEKMVERYKNHLFEMIDRMDDRDLRDFLDKDNGPLDLDDSLLDSFGSGIAGGCNHGLP